MLTDLPFCLQGMRCFVFVYICFYRQVRVYYDHAKISMHHLLSFSEKGRINSHKKAEKCHGTPCHII